MQLVNSAALALTAIFAGQALAACRYYDSTNQWSSRTSMCTQGSSEFGKLWWCGFAQAMIGKTGPDVFEIRTTVQTTSTTILITCLEDGDLTFPTYRIACDANTVFDFKLDCPAKQYWFQSEVWDPDTPFYGIQVAPQALHELPPPPK
ncbi:hypothetical protein E4U55_006423 [Claviceps digitariae]|nr:hypothetical protein E4U55_006423 [Claviceps digitariae]